MIDDTHSKLLHLSFAPHLRHGQSVPLIMRQVLLALAPALCASIYFFGMRALLLAGVCVCFSIVTEMAIVQFLLKRKSTVNDLSAVVSGLLLALTLPPQLPLWMAAIGAIFAMSVAKWAFGGLGNNFINPALAGWAFLMAAYPTAMNLTCAPGTGTIHGMATMIDGLTAATPLAMYKQALMLGKLNALDLEASLANLFIGNVGGSIGETSAIALLAGAMFLGYKHIIGFRIPFTFVFTVFILFWFNNGSGELFSSEALIVPVFQVLSGGLLLGALFMATDMVTSPVTRWGKTIFGVGCGVLTFIIRKFGGYPEGVAYAILIMNCLVPLLDRYGRPRLPGKALPRG
jgi:electron transport complex protein RnfD